MECGDWPGEHVYTDFDTDPDADGKSEFPIIIQDIAP
jgi:hypothetical protein